MTEPPLPPPLPDAPPPVPVPDGPPAPARPGPPRLPTAFVVLGLLLAVSIVASVTLGVRLATVDRELADARAALQTALATQAPAPSSGSPATSAISFGSPVLDGIARAVEKLRGLKFKRSVPVEVLSAEQLRARVDSQFKKDESKAQIESAAKTLKELGLLASSDDLYRIEYDVQTEQVAGYYDNKARKLVVTGDPNKLSPLSRVLMAHELTHAVTDQNFGLDTLDKLQAQHADDEAEAYLALIEGDATLMMFLYRQQYLTTDEQKQMDDESSSQSSPKLDAAPPVVKRDLLFPYDEGVQFAQALYQRGGTAAIDAAYRTPPSSTEQILHPDKFFNRDDPTKVSMPNLAAALGDGWKQVDSGGFGELDVQTTADQFLPSGDAKSAAQGWDGGRYETLESPRGVLVAVSTVWDGTSEADDAASAFRDWLRPRFGDQGSPFSGTNESGWESKDGAGVVERHGATLVLVLGPDRDSVTRAAQSL